MSDRRCSCFGNGRCAWCLGRERAARDQRHAQAKALVVPITNLEKRISGIREAVTVADTAGFREAAAFLSEYADSMVTEMNKVSDEIRPKLDALYDRPLVLDD